MAAILTLEDNCYSSQTYFACFYLTGYDIERNIERNCSRAFSGGDNPLLPNYKDVTLQTQKKLRK